MRMMSRSYKKNPGFVDRDPYMKRYANSRVRRAPNVPSGKSYRKFSNSYDISDWSWTSTDPETLDRWTDGKAYKARIK